MTRASLLARQGRTSLLEPDLPLQEQIITLKPEELGTLQTNIETLEKAAKEALFAERVAKPVFFDTAFNYVDLPMDELEVLAGKKKAAAPVTPSKITKGAVEKVKVASNRTTRETTPVVGKEEQVGEKVQDGEKPKGWLGGWFGRS